MNEKNEKIFGFHSKPILDLLNIDMEDTSTPDKEGDILFTLPNLSKVLEKLKSGEFSRLLGEAERVNRGVNKTLIDDTNEIKKTSIPNETKSHVTETAKTWKLEVLAPGVNKDNLYVKIVPSKNPILLRALLECNDLLVGYIYNGVIENEAFGKSYFTMRSFEKRFELPRNLVIDSIKSEYKDGILCITGEKVIEAELKEEKSIDIKIN
jgi:HSP20 family molecular chaperone IbpA